MQPSKNLKEIDLPGSYHRV